jgi:hypothetical protein
MLINSPIYSEGAMADDSKKNLFKSPLFVFLFTFVSLAVLLTLLTLLNGLDSLFTICTYFLYGGMIVAIIGFAFLNKGSSRWDGYTQSKYIKNDELFKKIRAEEKPFERIVLAVIFAAISIAAIGYFLNEFLVK